MSIIERVSVSEDVTLISLNNSPADINLISYIFERIAQAEIDVDMISQTPPNSRNSSLSFTVSDDSFGDILKITSELRKANPEMKFNVSNGNCKISVFGKNMQGTPGVAAKVFETVARAGADIRMITTSEQDISILVTKSDLNSVLSEINDIKI